MTLDVVPAVVAWREAPSSLYADLCRRHEELLWERLEGLLEGASGHAKAEAVEAAVRALRPEARRRLLTAPETAQRLTYRREPDYTFLLNAARAETYRDSQAVDAPDPVWTALGDHYFPAGRRTRTADDRRPCLSWAPDRELEAPRLAACLPIDHFSPLAVDPRRTASSRRFLSAEGLQACVARLEDALGRILTVSAAPHAVITSFVRVIVLWSDGGPSLMEFSTERFVGRVVLSNVQGKDVDAVTLASALIHEATHSFVYLLEEWDPLIPNREASREVAVASPWTGRKLGLHSFVQACFVWFGLWQFFKRAMEGQCFDRGRVEEELKRSKAGFGQPGLAEAMAATVPHLSASARAVVESLLRDIERGAYD